VNVSEYLATSVGLRCSGERPSSASNPFSKAIWTVSSRGGPEQLGESDQPTQGEDSRFHTEGGSWTNNISWVRGYDKLLDPMQKASAHFFEKVIKPRAASSEPRYRNALFHLLCSQTSCYRYWGEGIWAEYGREICRRLEAILQHDF